MTERLTRRQAAIISAFTGILCGPFEDVQALGDELFGRPTWSHEYGSKAFADQFRDAARPLFLDICADRDDCSMALRMADEAEPKP